jgi:hypothetical protein
MAAAVAAAAGIAAAGAGACTCGHGGGSGSGSGGASRPDGGVLVLRDGGLNLCPKPDADGRMHYEKCVPATALPASASKLYVLPPEILGPLPRDEVRMLLTESMPRLTPCFEAVLEKEPGITGIYKVQMAVDVDGTIAFSFTESGFGEHKVEACVGPILKEWRFLATPSPSKLTLRFELRPPGAPLGPTPTAAPAPAPVTGEDSP